MVTTSEEDERKVYEICHGIEEESQSKQQITSEYIENHHDEIRILSYYYMSDTPWSSLECHQRSKKVLDKFIKVLNEPDERINTIKEELHQYLLIEIQKAFEKLPSSATASNLNRTVQQRVIGGLAPQLGYSLAGSTYEKRNQWKAQRHNLQTISLLYFEQIAFVSSEKDLRKAWHVYVPAILKILDDTDGIIKSLGCRVLNVVLDRLDTLLGGVNYLTKSGIYEELIGSISVCLTYIPTLTSSTEKSTIILKEAYNTLVKLITTCAVDINDRDDKLIALLCEDLIDRIPLVMALEPPVKLPILETYVKTANGIIDLLDSHRPHIQSVLVLRKALWKFVFPILTDAFLFLGNQQAVLLFAIELLVFTLKLLSHTTPRVGQYKYDILSAMVLFVERYENEINNNINKLDFVNRMKISEVVEETTEKEKELINPLNKNISNLVTAIFNEVKNSYNDDNLAASEFEQLAAKKPVIEEYL